MPNRLATETSPYLRQHAANPVDWYPWGHDAFEEARHDDKPIFLSVGYSSCHWCHVMAHESFEDETTAELLNERFVSIKVDREELPDVDSLYMDAVVAMTGRGGWPMTVFLTPDGEPFFGGTYFPKVAVGSTISFTDLLERIDSLWRSRRSDVVEQARELTAAIARDARLVPDGALPSSEVLDIAVRRLCQRHDAVHGGFGSAPKFPQAMTLELLLRTYRRTGSPDLLRIVTTSLDAMASGGIYDHLGGGFARYSVDARWLVPHFEKMLYDQALLARVYLHAWQATHDPRYLQVVEETIGYVLRDLRNPRGGFLCAEDADSEGEEGRFYLWSLGEVRDVLEPLGADLAAAAIDWWGISGEGNFEGRNILWRPARGELVRPPSVEAARQALFEARSRRQRPGLDDKVVTEWHGLMVSTLAEAAMATHRRDWLSAACEGGEFALSNLRSGDGRWMRSWRGQSRHLAYASDHASMLDAFVHLGEATGRAVWLSEARLVADRMLELFWDDANGGLFSAGDDAAQLVVRSKDLTDAATPSANSQAALGLVRLSALNGEARYSQRADSILRLLAEPATRHPEAFANLLCALDLAISGPTEVVISGDRPDLVDAVGAHYLPNAVLAWGEPYDSPLWEGRDAGPDGLGRAYVCRDHTCEAPVADVDQLVALLEGT